MPATKTAKSKKPEIPPGKMVRVRVKDGCKGFDGLQMRFAGDVFLLPLSMLKLEGDLGTKDTDSIEYGVDKDGKPVFYSLGSWLEDAKKPKPVVEVEDEEPETGELNENVI